MQVGVEPRSAEAKRPGPRNNATSRLWPSFRVLLIPLSASARANRVSPRVRSYMYSVGGFWFTW